jgi:hypothetical protein
MEPKEKSFTEIEGIVQDAIAQAVDFVESEITNDRIKAQRYFDGEVDIGYEDGRSSVVATKVRDTVRAVKPSLMRVFMSTARPVEFIPKGPEDVAFAEQATDYMHYVFNQNDGFRVLNDAFHDALVKKQGIVKVYWDTRYRTETYSYTDLNQEERDYILSDMGISVIEETMTMTVEMDQMGVEVELPSYSLKVSRSIPEGKLRIESVPPEEFFVNSQARTLEDAYVVCHRSEVRVGELVEMGYPFEEVYDLDSLYGASDISEAEDIERRGYAQDDYEDQSGDPAMRNVAITEAYMRLDVEGTGVPVLHRFICGGSNYKMLDFERVDEVPFAVFEVDPEPHTMYGRSLAELIMDDQDASTAIIRGILDNVAMTNNPRIGIVDGAVNIDDVLNNEIGAIVRMRQAGAVQDLAVPFTAGQTLSALQYMDGLVEQKTGVSQNVALNPDAMQSTTAAGVQATVDAAAAQVEVMVRNLSEGMRRMFKLLLSLHVKNVDEEMLMRMNGQFVPVDPRVWNADMDVQINVGLGTGREQEKAAALQGILQIQQQVYQQYGPMNGLVSLTNIRNTLADVLAASGVRNAERYFAPITPEIEGQMMQMQQQQQMEQSQMAQAQMPDPNAAILQAEQIKAQAKMNTDMMKIQLDAQKAAAEDDRKRDQMAQDLLVDAAKIYGQYGTNVDVARIKAEQDKLRTVANIAQGGSA